MLPEAVVTAKRSIFVVGQTPQKPTTTLSRLSYVELQERPALCPPDSLGLHAANFQSEFYWDWDSLVLFAAALSCFMKETNRFRTSPALSSITIALLKPTLKSNQMHSIAWNGVFKRNFAHSTLL